MSENLHIRAEFSIKPENLTEFITNIKELSKVVEKTEPATIEYLFYLNENQTICHVLESYLDSSAAIIHNDNPSSKTILEKILKIAIMNKIDVYGAPNDELKKILSNLDAQKFLIETGYRR